MSDITKPFCDTAPLNGCYVLSSNVDSLATCYAESGTLIFVPSCAQGNVLLCASSNSTSLASSLEASGADYRCVLGSKSSAAPPSLSFSARLLSIILLLFTCLSTLATALPTMHNLTNSVNQSTWYNQISGKGITPRQLPPASCGVVRALESEMIRWVVYWSDHQNIEGCLGCYKSNDSCHRAFSVTKTFTWSWSVGFNVQGQQTSRRLSRPIWV
jgi:hypothetical protein